MEPDVSSPGQEALQGLEALQGSAFDLIRLVREPTVPANEQLKPLQQLIESMGQDRPARAIACPEEFRAQWQEFQNGLREDLEPRAVRYLCWESDIATHLDFHSYLRHSAFEPNARAIQGLVRSCHQRWSADLFSRSGVAERVRILLVNYEGPNRVVQRWQDAIHMILGRSGADQFGKQMLEDRRSPSEQCRLHAVDEQSGYVLQATKSALVHWNKLPASSRAKLDVFVVAKLVFWDNWPRDASKEVIAAAILEGERLADSLTPRILKLPYLGDPRLPTNQPNWRGVNAEARDRFISWLSAEDIAFFFEHVLPKGHDPHGRKPFWLGYVNQVRMSRAVLNWEDRARLKGATIKGRPINFGSIDASTSAFLLDFDRVLVVEFGSTGNACYVYEKTDARRIIQDFWTTETFRVSRWLDNSLKQPDRAVAKIAHFNGWESNMQQVLAKYGIRPTSDDWR